MNTDTITIPARLRELALARQANVGREYDSAGRHVAYYLRLYDGRRIYRQSMQGMLALLRRTS